MYAWGCNKREWRHSLQPSDLFVRYLRGKLYCSAADRLTWTDTGGVICPPATAVHFRLCRAGGLGLTSDTSVPAAALYDLLETCHRRINYIWCLLSKRCKMSERQTSRIGASHKKCDENFTDSNVLQFTFNIFWQRSYVFQHTFNYFLK